MSLTLYLPKHIIASEVFSAKLMAYENERRALYPGSFDPPTNGHKWVIQKVADQFDKGFVAIGINPEKPGRFPTQQRAEMLQEIATEFPNIAVTSFLGLLQADFAEMVGARYIIRGTRNSADFSYESDNRHVNTTINPNLETVVFIPPKELLQVSSSMVMGLVGFEGWKTEVAKMVPNSVLKRLESMQDAKDKEYLERKWQDLCRRLGTKGNTTEIFESLYKRYDEPHRFYHNQPHIKMCLNELELVQDLASNPDAIELAFWYHDAIYDSAKQPSSPQSQPVDDEGLSAELAQEDIKRLGLSPEFAQKVGSLILLTKHNSVPKDNDEQLLADIDLAIFGRSSRLFDLYEQNVRTEFGLVPQKRFSDVRRGVLQGFLDRPSIYYTDFFRSRYEKQAQKNLQRSIRVLSK